MKERDEKSLDFFQWKSIPRAEIFQSVLLLSQHLWICCQRVQKGQRQISFLTVVLNSYISYTSLSKHIFWFWENRQQRFVKELLQHLCETLVTELYLMYGLWAQTDSGNIEEWAVERKSRLVLLSLTKWFCIVWQPTQSFWHFRHYSLSRSNMHAHTDINPHPDLQLTPSSTCLEIECDSIMRF